VELREGLIRDSGLVEKIERSRIPKVLLISFRGNVVNVKMDLLRDLLVFNEGDKVEFVLSREMPQYVEGRDFLGWGYVVSKKRESVKSNAGEVAEVDKLLVSLWGYLFVIESKEKISDLFEVMDKVYVKISKEGS